MRLLLDTHIWVWSVADESRLTDTVRRTLADPAHERWISAISVWEVLILAERGRLILEPDPQSWVRQALADAPVREAPVQSTWRWPAAPYGWVIRIRRTASLPRAPWCSA